MRKPTNQKQFYSMLLLFCVSLAACQKWVSVPPPVTQVTADGAFSNDVTASTTVTGLFSQMMAGSPSLLNGALSLYPSLSSDDLALSVSNAVAGEFAANQLSSRNTAIAGFWTDGYRYVYQINACLAGITGSSAISSGTRNRLTGELLFMRAFVNFYLVNLFSDVPLLLTTDYAINATQPRNAPDAVYQQIANDLTEAESRLASISSPTGATEPTQMAVAAFFARVHLYRREWPEAEAAADKVINIGRYHLETTPATVFLPGSLETILQLVPVIPGVNTAEAINFIPSAGVTPLYVLQAQLLASFEAGDSRRTVWTDSVTTTEGTLYYPFKYKAKSSADGTEYNVVLRLSEQYLIRAEARAQQGDITGAVSDMNVIRDRAGVSAVPDTLSAADCLTGIAKENQHEFFAEWGHRWFDLKRTGQATAVLQPLKSGWEDTDALYPIPYSQLLLNPNLVQNPGY